MRIVLETILTERGSLIFLQLVQQGHVFQQKKIYVTGIFSNISFQHFPEFSTFEERVCYSETVENVSFALRTNSFQAIFCLHKSFDFYLHCLLNFHVAKELFLFLVLIVIFWFFFAVIVVVVKELCSALSWEPTSSSFLDKKFCFTIFVVFAIFRGLLIS